MTAILVGVIGNFCGMGFLWSYERYRDQFPVAP